MKRILFVLAVLLAATILTSCSKQMIYPAMVKDGTTEQQKKTDAFECKTMAVDFKNKYEGGGAPSFGMYGMAGHKRRSNDATDAANDYYIECMELRGYGIVKEK